MSITTEDAPTRKPLTDTLRETGLEPLDSLSALFDSTTAADELRPLPRGTYTCRAMNGGLTTANSGTRMYRVRFKVLEGEHAGRCLWKSWPLTPAALPYSKRELAKLGVISGDKLNAPLPPDEYVVRLGVVVRSGDDGVQRNEVRSIEFVRRDAPRKDPCAPTDEEETAG